MASCSEELEAAVLLATASADKLGELTQWKHELLRPWLDVHEYAVWKDEFETRFGAKPGEQSDPVCVEAVWWRNLWRAIEAEIARILSEPVTELI